MSVGRATIWWIVLAAVLGGCGRSGPKMVPVSGTVLLDGAPLPAGEIYFLESQSSGPTVFPVSAGKFEGRLTVGPKRVEVYWTQKVQVPPERRMGPEPTVNLIHSDYNVDSKLTAQVLDDGTLRPAQFDVKRSPAANLHVNPREAGR
jgi:hypothetical protein